MPQPLNIVYLHSHDTGRMIAPYGYAAPTPNLQKFAEQGVLFRNAFCANPTCSPSRAALLTGQYAHCNGMLGLAHRGFSLNDYRQHVIHTLAAQGYASALCGTQHVAHGPDCATGVIGYDEVLPMGDGGDRVAPVSAFLRRGHEQPFFLSVGFGLTHRTGRTGVNVQWHNGEASPVGDPRYVRPPAPIPDTPDTRRDFADFLEAARRLDECYGQILRTLDETGLADRTLVLITTDHGIAYPGMKCNLTDHGTGVLMMMRGPESTGFTGGRVIDALASHVDVFPTLCDVLGIAPPPWLQGVSLLPLVKGEKDAVRDEVFAEVNYHAAYEPARMVRTARHRLIRRYDGRDRRVLPNCDDSVTKSLLVEAGWATHAMEPEQLYDLTLDPAEARNVAGDPRYADVLADLRGRLDRWMKDTNDPLLRGPVEAPAGAVANPPDQYSPGEPPAPARP